MSVRSVNATEVAHHVIAAAIVAPIDAHGIDHAIEDDKKFILTKLTTFSYSYKNLVFFCNYALLSMQGLRVNTSIEPAKYQTFIDRYILSLWFNLCIWFLDKIFKEVNFTFCHFSLLPHFKANECLYFLLVPQTFLKKFLFLQSLLLSFIWWLPYPLQTWQYYKISVPSKSTICLFSFNEKIKFLINDAIQLNSVLFTKYILKIDI